MKTPEDDFFLGHTVLEKRTVSREALLECLFMMAQERKAGQPRPLGASARTILAIRSRNDPLLAASAIVRGGPRQSSMDSSARA